MQMVKRIWNRFGDWRRLRKQKQAEELAGLSDADREVIARGHDASRRSEGDWGRGGP